MVRLRGIIPFYGRKIQGSDILFHVPRSMGSDGISMGFQWDFNGIWLNYNDRTLFSLTGIMVRLRGIIPFYGRKFQVSELLISDTQMGSYWKMGAYGIEFSAQIERITGTIPSRLWPEFVGSFVRHFLSLHGMIPAMTMKKPLVPTGWCPRILVMWFRWLTFHPMKTRSLYISTINHRFQPLFVRRFGSRELVYGGPIL